MATQVPVLMLCFLLMVNFCRVLVTSARTPRIDGDTSLNITYDIGKNAILSCRVDNIRHGNTVIWRRLFDPIPISIGTTKFSRSKKYRVNYDSTKKTWTLYIRKLDRGDAGEYECSVTGADKVSKTVSIIMKSDDNTYIEAIESIIVADPGETVLLPCKVVNLKKNKVLWVNEKGEVLAFRKRIYAGDNRLQMVHPTRGEWSLRIKRLVDEDFGSYTCIVNGDPVLTRTTTLKRKGPPRIPPRFMRDNHVMDVKVHEGSLVTLTCNFEGYPEPRVSWSARIMVEGRRVKKKFSTVGSDLVIDGVTPQDAGNYTCTGTNGIRPLSRGKVRLAVEPLPTTPAPKTTPSEPTGPSSPITYAEDERVGKRKGHTAYLVCHSVGHPPPKMYWKRHGAEVHNNYQFRVQTTVVGQKRRRTELRVNYLGGEDFGDYECFGHNNRGHSGSKVILFEIFD